MNLLPRDLHPNGMTAATFKNRRKITRDKMAERLMAVLQIINTQTEMITHLESRALKLKTGMITKQDRVIVLQEELIAAKDDQLNELKETVVSSVGVTIKIVRLYMAQGMGAHQVEVVACWIRTF